MAAPVESFTYPTMFPVAIWASTGTTSATVNKARTSKTQSCESLCADRRLARFVHDSIRFYLQVDYVTLFSNHRCE